MRRDRRLVPLARLKFAPLEGPHYLREVIERRSGSAAATSARPPLDGSEGLPLQSASEVVLVKARVGKEKGSVGAYAPAAIAALSALIFVVGLLHVVRGRRLERQRAKDAAESLASDRLANIDQFVR